jgi:hypothetical protein
MKTKLKRDLVFIFVTILSIVLIILLMACFSINEIEERFIFSSGLIFGFLISQFLFLFFNKNNKAKLKKTKRENNGKYWWNDGMPPNFKH